MEAPQQIKPAKLADYLEVLSKAVFEAGMNWKVIENKWPGFREAFHQFDPATIAAYTPDDTDRLMADTRIVRNMRKVEATIHNAQAMLEVEREFGSFAKYLEAKRPFDSQLADNRKPFKHVGNFAALLPLRGGRRDDHLTFGAWFYRGGRTQSKTGRSFMNSRGSTAPQEFPQRTIRPSLSAVTATMIAPVAPGAGRGSTNTSPKSPGATSPASVRSTRYTANSFRPVVTKPSTTGPIVSLRS